MTEIKAAGYSVYINKDIASDINKFFKAGKNNFSKVFILADENSLKFCYPRLAAQVDSFKDAEIIEIESGEENKSIEVCMQIWTTLSEFGADRNSLFVNLGGGVIGDMGGFIASTFKRGIRFINIPTTLLAQVDASVGGKVGIDLNHLKNEIGVFNTPVAVFIDPEFLGTLEKRQLLSGYAEIIKHALIADAAYWKKLNAAAVYDLANSEELIETSVHIKNRTVLEDPLEKGLRKILNFGHTIGHAIETLFLEDDSKKTMLHGEAIAAGMICEAFLSAELSTLSKTELAEITKFILHRYEAAAIEEKDFERLTAIMKHDKKNDKAGINFSLLSAIGSCEINKTAAPEQIINALNYYRKEAKTVHS